MNQMKIPYEFPVITQSEAPEKQRTRTLCKAKIIPIELEQEPYEATVEAFGLSYHLLFGRQINGSFLCIPNWHFGCELAELSDTCWNLDSIIGAKGEVDETGAAAIVFALKTLDGFIGY